MYGNSNNQFGGYGQAKPQQQQQYGGYQQQGYGGQQQPQQGYAQQKKEQYTPVTSLNPYCGQWKIKVRVTGKDTIRHWKNDRGEGKVTSINLLDEFGGEIRATMFGDEVDRIYPQMMENKVYVVSGGQIKMARKQYTHIKNDYAITFSRDTQVEFCQDETGISSQVYNFVQINQLPQMAPTQDGQNVFVDIVGVVIEKGEAIEIESKKSGKRFKKMALQVMDATASVELTIWGDDCEKIGGQNLAGNVICVKACKVSSFSGCSLSGGTISVSPTDQPKATDCETWYRQHVAGGGQITPSITTQFAGGGNNYERMTYDVTQQRQLGLQNEKGDYFQVRATISNIVHATESNDGRDRRPWYTACPSNDCNKKVQQNPSGQWECQACQSNGKQWQFPQCQPRYIMRFNTQDHTGSQWLSCFNDVAEQILGKPAAELNGYLDQGNTEAYEQVFANANFSSWIFNCRAKSEVYQDEQRVKMVVRSCQPLNFVEESSLLIEKIRAQMS